MDSYTAYLIRKEIKRVHARRESECRILRLFASALFVLLLLGAAWWFQSAPFFSGVLR